MKRALLLAMLLIPVGLMAQTDTSQYVWTRNGKMWHGDESFQRWSGHFWDTLATKRFVLEWVAAHLYGSGQIIGDSLQVGNGGFTIYKYTPAYTDSMIAVAQLAVVPFTTSEQTYLDFGVTAPAYTNPPITWAEDATNWTKFGVSMNAHIAAHSGNYLCDIGCYVDVKKNGTTWTLDAEQYNNNTLGYPPFWDNVEHTWNIAVGPSLDYTVGGYGKYQQYISPSPNNSWWNWGIVPGAVMEIRVRASLTGAPSSGSFTNITVGSHYGAFFMWGASYTVPAAYHRLFRVDSSGQVILYGNLNTRNATIKGVSAYLDWIVLGHYPGMPDTTYRAYPDTERGSIDLITPQTGHATLLSSGGNSAAGYNQTFTHKIDTTYTHADTVVTDTRLNKNVQEDTSIHVIKTGVAIKIKGFFKYAGSGNEIHYIYTDSNMVNRVSHDTLYLASAGGGGGGTASYSTYPTLKPPTTPSAFDDEFNGRANGLSVDTVSGVWRWSGRGGASNNPYVTYQQGRLVWIDTGKAAGKDFAVRFLYRSTSDTAWTITVRCGGYDTNTSAKQVGIWVRDSANGKMIKFGFFWQNNFTEAEIENWTNNYTYSATPYAGFATAFINSDHWYKLEKTTAKMLNFYISYDGLIWYRVYSAASTAFIETAGNRINQIGIGTLSNVQGMTLHCWFDFFRYNWTADFDATLNK